MADNINAQERIHALQQPLITDKTGGAIFESVLQISNSDAATHKYEDCDAKRLGSGIDQHDAAYTYFALGFGIAASRFVVSSNNAKLSPAEMFHFAGHAFREIGQMNRAADAYWRAGVIGEQITDLSVRSLARAKSSYSEIGETDKSDEMHRLEWDARRTRSHGLKWILLLFWKITSGYGTRSGRWFLWVAALVLAFTLGYQALHHFGCITSTQTKLTWTPWITAAYMAVVTTGTVGYGDFVPSGPVAEVVVILNIILAYALLAIGSTILGRKVLAR